jgi:chromosomal replication initiator protein
MDAKQVWLAALERIQRRVSPGVFSTWFSGTIGLELRQHRLSVAVPSVFACDHLRQRFHELARVAASEVIGQSAEIAFVLREVARAPTASARQSRGHPTRRATVPLAQQTGARRGPRVALSSDSAQRAYQPPLVPLQAARQSTPAPSTIPLRAPDRNAPATAGFHLPRASQDALAMALRPARESQHAIHELHPRYLFEAYIVGDANRLAYAAALEVASAPGETYNPLFLYGGVGLGKTHLLHAIGHYARAAGRKVAYVTAERFTNEIIEAIRLRTTDAFRLRFRAVDVLLVDDVQFIAGKESTEEEFFHTFNTLHESNKQIVLSSDRVPSAMHHLHDRLRSRFQWGLIADIQPPDYEQRIEILRAKAAAMQLRLPEDVLVYLARPECENIRALEGALNRVVAHAQMLQQPLDAQLVAQALAPLEAEHAERPIEAGEVLAAVARHFGVSVEALRGKSREHAVAWARQVAMYVLREETPASLLQIGQYLGGRDHTTIMHGHARVGSAIAKDARARADVATIRGSLRG